MKLLYSLLLALPFATQAQTTTYTTPGAYAYPVPAGVRAVRVVATGASGGVFFDGSSTNYTYGARVQATVLVTPGEVLTVQVGGQGGSGPNSGAAGGYNGGGTGGFTGAGGGASDVRRASANGATGDYLTTRNALLVAGGGGGSDNTGGNGGTPNGGDGTTTAGPGNAGLGATQSGPGNGGGNPGSASTGGAGSTGAGGGGGYYGGGGSSNPGGGGGGSSWVMPTGSSISYSVATVVGDGVLTITPTAAPLPVQLTAFTAEAAGGSARLRWATASETDNDHFEVEASADGSTFARLGTVAGHGTTLLPQQYAYLDENIARYGAPLVYYRLRQVDRDGKATYSQVRAVGVGTSGLSLYPNPARRTTTLSGAEAGAKVQVYNALGSLVLITQADTTGTATLALPANLPGGLYLVRSSAGPALRLTVE